MPRNNMGKHRGLGMDPRTKENELEVQNIIDLQRIANELPEAFIILKGL
jgi:hypothetical protein